MTTGIEYSQVILPKLPALRELRGDGNLTPEQETQVASLVAFIHTKMTEYGLECRTEGVEHERQRCVKVCEAQDEASWKEFPAGYWEAKQDCIAAIRKGE